MFCDLVGSTALAERLDPEELHELLAQYQDSCADVIHGYEGHIARYVGDGLLVYFGYPQAHEDDPHRAVRAGLGIVSAMQGLHAKVTNPEVNLAVRIGITTGMVVAGDIGSGQRREEKAIVGETPNLAARLQALAEPNTVVIGASTQRLIEGLFDCDDLGLPQLKGISQPVNAYRVRQESGIPSRFEARATRGLAPMVGRDEEIGVLLKRWTQTRDGEGQVLLLSGEAGIGKSRIVRGFQERLKNELRNRVLYYCSPYHQNSAFYPAIDQLERALRFEKSDSEAQKLDKLEAMLGELGLRTQAVAPILAHLLSLSLDDCYPERTLSPEELKKKTLETIVALIEAMAAKEPVLMVVEDIHWIDPSTFKLISLLIEQLPFSRLFLLITFRPDFGLPWSAHGHITSLSLNRFDRKESTALISKVTKGKTLPEDVLEQIIAKTDGVPLFIEELTKTVLESDLLKDAGDRYALSGSLTRLAIPASLQDSLMARLDHLGTVKEVAQLAAVLGRRFSHELLVAASQLDQSVIGDALSRLVQAELIYRRGLPPDVTYEFKHALVQDTAYESLLKGQRQQYHQRVARVLEEQFLETAESEPEVVARHYTEAQLSEKAIEYWYKAGQRVSERFANVEAIAHLSRGLELIDGLPQTPERAKQELALNLALGPALMAIQGYAAPEVAPVYVRARELCQQVGMPSQLFAATWGLWLYSQQAGQLKKARGLAEEVLALAERQNHPAWRVQAHHAAWATFYRLAEFPACRQHAEQGIALYNVDEHRHHAYLYGGHDPGVCGRSHASAVLWCLGYPAKALDNAQDGLALGQRLLHPFSLADALIGGTRIHQFRREPHLVRERAEAMIELCTEHGFSQIRAWGTVTQGWALAAGGQVEAGIAEMQQGLAAMRATGAQAHAPYFFTLLAEGYGRAGRADEGLNTLVEALDLVEKTGERTWEAEIYRLKGELLLMRSRNNQHETEGCFNRAIDIAREHSAKSLELRAATSLSRLWHDQGRRAQARALLAPIYEWFTEGFDTADLKEA
ncbi:MAG: AAA family ATPase, partial [Acidiferrobacterales bacterium]